MSRPTVTFHNTETGEIETREMTSAELAEHTAMKERYENLAAEAQAKAQAKAELLERLGITADEAKLLLS